MTREDRIADLNDGFSQTVSDRAFESFCPIEGSFAHDGINPQIDDVNTRCSLSSSSTVTLADGAMLNLAGEELTVSSTTASRNEASSCDGRACTNLPHMRYGQPAPGTATSAVSIRPVVVPSTREGWVPFEVSTYKVVP